MIGNKQEVSRDLEKALQALQQAKQRVANEKKKQNEKKHKAENHHKYIMGGIIVKYFPDCYLVLVYKCGQKKLNNLYYQMKEQRRCSTWRKIKNLTLRSLNSRSWICIMPEEPRIHNWNVNMA